MQLRQFNSHNLTSVEKEMRQVKEPENLSDLGKMFWSLCYPKEFTILSIHNY